MTKQEFKALIKECILEEAESKSLFDMTTKVKHGGLDKLYIQNNYLSMEDIIKNINLKPSELLIITNKNVKKLDNPENIKNKSFIILVNISDTKLSDTQLNNIKNISKKAIVVGKTKIPNELKDKFTTYQYEPKNKMY